MKESALQSSGVNFGDIPDTQEAADSFARVESTTRTGHHVSDASLYAGGSRRQILSARSVKPFLEDLASELID
jgi:hypothetical protein